MIATRQLLFLFCAGAALVFCPLRGACAAPDWRLEGCRMAGSAFAGRSGFLTTGCGFAAVGSSPMRSRRAMCGPPGTEKHGLWCRRMPRGCIATCRCPKSKSLKPRTYWLLPDQKAWARDGFREQSEDRGECLQIGENSRILEQLFEPHRVRHRRESFPEAMRKCPKPRLEHI
jgi:hypothetical protein